MENLPSYEELQDRITTLENDISYLKSRYSKATNDINPTLFFEICEYSKNAIALFESKDNGKSFIIKYFNKKAEELEKVNRDKITGKNLINVFPSVKASGFLDALQRVFKQNKAEEFPAIAFSSGKFIEWKQNYIYKLTDNEIVSIYVDETISKNKEFELKEHREKLQIAMEAASYFSFEIDLKTYKISVLSELYLALGYDKSEFDELSQKTGNLIHPEDYKKAQELITKHARRIKAALNLEFRVKHKKGSWTWLKATGRIINWDKSSEPLKLVGLVRIIQEEKEVWLKLEESESRLKLAMESASQALIDWNVKEDLIYYSPEWYRMFEYNPDEIVINYDFTVKIAHPEDVPAAVGKLEDHINGKTEFFNAEVRMKTKSGKWKWILTHGKIVRRDSDGSPIRAIGIQTDITSIKVSEQKLKESEEKFKSLATLLPEVIFETDIHGNITFVNLKAFEIFEYLPKDLDNGLHFVQLLAPEEIARAQKNISLLHKKENLPGEEYTAITKNGKRFPILVYSNVIKTDNNVTGIRGLIVNITDLKKTQQQLEITKENFRQLSENINDAFWLRSLDQKVIYANRACYKIVGERFKEIFEDFNSYKNWIHPEDREKIVDQRKHNLQYLYKNHFYEHRMIKPNGEIRWLWIRTFPVFDSNGKLYRRAGIASDITRQKKLMTDLLEAKEKAEESDKLKSAFLANMSHEIRTPMNGILGFAELLKDEDISNQERLEYLKIIDSNGKQLLNLINDIIDIAKIEAGQLSVNKKIFEINPLLEEIYQMFFEHQNRHKKQDIKFILKIPSGKTNTIFTDDSRLKQIFNNLLSNAFKFTESGSISFGYSIVKKDERYDYQFFVSDTGIGINKNMQNIIFERFGQLETKKHNNQQGTGLGLAISKGLIELLNGEIWFDSYPEDSSSKIQGGCTFYFTIPISHTTGSKEPKRNEFKAAVKMKNLENVHVLVVEDDNDNLELLRRFLVKFGAQVIIARSGSEAIEAVQSNKHIKVVLMDIRLPDINGFETTQQIKEINPNLRVIAQTAYAMYNDREVCLQNGCDDYMSKPLDKDVLFEKINQYIYI